MADTFDMTTGQAHEFAMACGRNGLTRADIKLLSTGDNLRRSIDWLNGTTATPPEKPKLLEPVGSVPVAATQRFIAADHFVVDTSKKAKVKIAFLWDNFKTNFVPKVETDVPAGELKIHKLLRNSFDAPLIAELDPAHETYLADLWMMLLGQPNGEEKKDGLLVNGMANIFYIRDAKGVLWAVFACWYAADGGWNLRANSVAAPPPWNAGYQVVSR
jgi:hypothetical protein